MITTLALLCALAAVHVLVSAAVQARGLQRPALPPDVRAAPLLEPAPAPDGHGGFRFLHTQDDGSGRPVRWDPCRPVHYVLRDVGAPVGAQQELASALAEIGTLTGLEFVYDGPTLEAPQQQRPLIQPDRYGRRWAPVLIAWTDPAEYPTMAGFAGLGGGDPVAGHDAGTRRYVSGVVLLNREHLRTVATWPDGHRQVRAVILHELGHLVGLDHVDDPAQLMHQRPTTRTQDLAAGDRRGLAALSRGPCFRDF